jgi:diguanylate cyclase (GGDEF)-like protein
MKKNHFNFVLITTLLSVIFLSALWEFWLEDIIGPFFGHDHRAESFWVRLEYVISITFFVTISLMIPSLVGYKLIENHEKLTEKIKRLSEEDYLTRLYNRRKIHEVIDNEILRSRRYNSDFAIILFDIDNFKTTNDTFGHNIGDKLLVEIAHIIRQTIRETDIAGRWGGEEFLIFCPQTGRDGAFALAEKLRANIEKHEFEDVGYKTASFGVAHIEHDDNVKAIINRADQALYSAKDSGKNMVLASG